MKSRFLFRALVILLVASLPAVSSAEREDRDRDDDVEEAASAPAVRDHLVTVSSFTLRPREFEIDLFSRFARGKSGTDSLDYFAHTAEAELGLTKFWTIGAGVDFEQPHSGGFSYTGLELESRVRLAEPGEWFMNPALALDFEIPRDSNAPKTLEGRLILDRKMGGQEVLLNGIYEQPFKSGAESEFGYSAGWFKSLTRSFGGGVEFTGNFEESEQAHYVIPGLYYGPREEVRFNLGASFGLTDESEPFGVRAFLELELE
jgi:hypothetical protein